MTPSILRGRAVVRGIIALVLGLYLFNPFGNSAGFVSTLVRFLLIAALCYQLDKGRAWARWILITLMAVAGGLVLVSSIEIVPEAFVVGAGWLALATLYLCVAGLLLFSPDVRAYLAYRNELGKVPSE